MELKAAMALLNYLPVTPRVTPRLLLFQLMLQPESFRQPPSVVPLSPFRLTLGLKPSLSPPLSLQRPAILY
ncbi:hypothetical protein WJX79_005480 [Trebouxia sp. C0005]